MTEWIFSNFRPLDKPIVYEGLSYPTVEHFYQAMKSPNPTYRSMIAACPFPGHAKMMGRHAKLIPNWNQVKKRVMWYALRYKFAPGTTHREKLDRATGPIVERNMWHDNEWGDCQCHKCRNKPGKNLLGQMLMYIRDKEIT
ncbi:MAG: NADAR family protein [Planctomycetaceae bacterium]|nr:NADAR family protein [Planctomycetaceae bacterium]